MQLTSLLAAILAVTLLAHAPIAAAADDASGIGAISAKDMRARIIHMDRRSFAVTEQTVIRNTDGNRISLSEVDVPELRLGETASPFGVLEANYTATPADGDDGGWVLRTLDLILLED